MQNRVKRVSLALILLWFAFSLLFSDPSYSEEGIHKMRILLVPVGGIDQQVIGKLQGDLSRIFKRRGT